MGMFLSTVVRHVRLDQVPNELYGNLQKRDFSMGWIPS